MNPFTDVLLVSLGVGGEEGFQAVFGNFLHPGLREEFGSLEVPSPVPLFSSSLHSLLDQLSLSLSILPFHISSSPSLPGFPSRRVLWDQQPSVGSEHLHPRAALS